MNASSKYVRGLPLLLALLIAGCAASSKAPTQAEITEEVSVEAKVLDVDPGTRELTLQRDDGTSVVVVAGPEVRNFDQIEAGDTVSARYVVSLSARLLGAEEVAAEPALALAAARAEPGERPAGMIGADVTLTVVVKSVDREQHVVVFTGPDGELNVVQAQREQGQRFVAGLKPGDRVELTYTEAVVLSVR